MLPNLQAEMKRDGISNKDLQIVLKCSEKTVRNKLSGTTAFSVWDAAKIRDAFFPHLQLEYLFAKDKEQNSA